MSSVRVLTMAEAKDSATLTARQRLALSKGSVDPSCALAMNDAELDVLFLRRYNVKTTQIRSARLTPLELKHRGLASAIGLRELGFDCLDLTDAAFCASAVSAFGVDAVKQAFLIDAGDAVAIAGSVAAFQLNVSVSKLVELCAGAPIQARAVLQQCEPRGGALAGVSANSLLDTGLRAATLCELGYFESSVREQTNATVEELRLLGFV